MMNYKKD